MNLNDLKDLQKVHTEVGIMLSRLSGINNIKELRKLQDSLSSRLIITPAKDLSDLYDVILDSIAAVKKENEVIK